MKKAFYITSLIALFTIQSCKKTTACMEISNEMPTKNTSVSIDGFCSEKAKWYEYEIDGNSVWANTTSDIAFTFTTVGPHTIKLTVYRHFNGTYNSRTGCNGCSGSGKSSSITKTINVVN